MSPCSDFVEVLENIDEGSIGVMDSQRFIKGGRSMQDRDYEREGYNKGRRSMYDRDYESDYTGWSPFVVGAFIAGGVALLLAPQTGPKLRGTIRNYASRATDEVAELGRQAWDTAVEHGKEYMEAGRQVMSEAGRSAREYAETGKEAWDTAVERGKEYIDSGRQAMSEAGRSDREDGEMGKEGWDTAVEPDERGRASARQYGETGKEASRTGKEAGQRGKKSRDEADRGRHSGRRNRYDRDYESDYTRWSAFVPGAFLGAGVALLLAPQTGSELRGMIRSYASRATDEVTERGREAWDTVVGSGKEYIGTGRQAMSEAGRSAREHGQTSKEVIGTGKEAVQAGKESVTEAGRGATTNR